MLALSWIVRNQIDQYFLFFLFLFLVLGELAVHMRYRGSLACRTCGFDPVIYKQDYKKARQLVQQTLAIRKDNPALLLQKPLRLPKISASRLEQVKTLEEQLQEVQLRLKQDKNAVSTKHFLSVTPSKDLVSLKQ